MPEKIKQFVAEKEDRSERMEVKLAKKTLAREIEMDMEPKRSGGYMLSTVVALGLVLFAGGKAEAQVRGVGPQSWGGGRGLIGEVMNRGGFGAGAAIDRSQAQKRAEIEQGYVQRLQELSQKERELDRKYLEGKNKLGKGQEAELQQLNAQYAAEKEQFAQAKVTLRHDYEKKVRKVKIKGQILDTILSGVRGGY